MTLMLPQTLGVGKTLQLLAYLRGPTFGKMCILRYIFDTPKGVRRELKFTLRFLIYARSGRIAYREKIQLSAEQFCHVSITNQQM